MSRASASGRPWQRVRAAILNRDGWRCRHCGAELHNRCLVTGCPTCAHVDHVLPRSKGGSDDPTNLVASCRRCNLARGDRMRHVAVPVAVNSRQW